jgi:hypothetical protein
LEHTGRLAILLPEILGDLRDSVDSDTVEIVLLNEVLDPVLEVAPDVGLVLVQIWQVGKPAVLNLSRVVPVSDLAPGMVVLLLVERVDF